jgi:hypothetical protein
MNTIKQGTHTVQPDNSKDWPTNDHYDYMGCVAILFVLYICLAFMLTWRKQAKKWGHKRC